MQPLGCRQRVLPWLRCMYTTEGHTLAYKLCTQLMHTVNALCAALSCCSKQEVLTASRLMSASKAKHSTHCCRKSCKATQRPAQCKQTAVKQQSMLCAALQFRCLELCQHLILPAGTAWRSFQGHSRCVPARGGSQQLCPALVRILHQAEGQPKWGACLGWRGAWQLLQGCLA